MHYYRADNQVGNVREFSYQKNVGDLDFKYLNEYGTAWRLRGPLMVSTGGEGLHLFHHLDISPLHSRTFS